MGSSPQAELPEGSRRSRLNNLTGCKGPTAPFLTTRNTPGPNISPKMSPFHMKSPASGQARSTQAQVAVLQACLPSRPPELMPVGTAPSAPFTPAHMPARAAAAPPTANSPLLCSLPSGGLPETHFSRKSALNHQTKEQQSCRVPGSSRDTQNPGTCFSPGQTHKAIIPTSLFLPAGPVSGSTCTCD
ncbi:hypothetical protein P7K49_027850 [Saguinus oedipus]|uniref:Uncharacterized protein n=1 Tax=Saguinus oedipus TaxID=9490 RepID=A0ABQ9UAL4_SAGOE|nr:hypothetical protein P7K49_027850 [Saguinus oedipus]